MFKSISSSSHSRSLILLLLLLSSDVHTNPGPFAFMRSFVINNNSQTVSVVVPSSFNSAQIAFSMVAATGNNSTLNITSTTPGFNFSFAPNITGTFNSIPMEIGPISSPFNITFAPSSAGNFYVLVSISFSNVETKIHTPLDVKVVNSTIEPVSVSGQVSIANPIPSVASTILNAFKK